MNIGREANWTVDPYGDEASGHAGVVLTRDWPMPRAKEGANRIRICEALSLDQARDLRRKLATALASHDHAERGRVLARRDAANGPW
jgi:hypothetical protein